MIFQKQKFMHDPDNKIYGDCFRTTIACFMNRLRDTVPHFYSDWSEPRIIQENRIDTWLSENGYRREDYLGESTLHDTHMNAMLRYKSEYYAICGISKLGCGHIVICKEGEIVWDPSLVNSGLVAPLNVGRYWITNFMPLEGNRPCSKN